MDKAGIRTFLQKDLASNKSTGEIKDSESLIELGILDSLSILKLVSFLEKQCSIKIEDIDLLPDNFETVDLIYSFVNKKKSGN
jgi:acyl carrier protein